MLELNTKVTGTKVGTERLKQRSGLDGEVRKSSLGTDAKVENKVRFGVCSVV